MNVRLTKRNKTKLSEENEIERYRSGFVEFELLESVRIGIEFWRIVGRVNF